ncbi:phage tail sheath family protein [Colwellia sp. MB3u-70]|nr:phage tail sheath family protein [Colwellia sp. MB3u-8]MBA6306281.1 phage tail sheath family protein [Colwellia sp. MB3u-70]
MGTMKTPGVYIVEKNAFPNSVVEVATAIPAFIGYTEKAVKDKKSLSNKPTRITSMAEFHNMFGLGPKPSFVLNEFKDDGTGKKTVSDITIGETQYTIDNSKYSPAYRLYYSMQLFFQNGGGPCYIVSVGNYKSGEDAIEAIKSTELKAGVAKLIKEQEPTMVVIPDAVSLADSAQCIDVQQSMLMHCGQIMRSRFALLDIYDGYAAEQDNDCVKNFRSDLGTNGLDFAAAYYPWINTNVVQDSDLSFKNLSRTEDEKAIGVGALVELIKAELNFPADGLSDKQTQQLEKVNGMVDDEVAQDDIKSNDLDKSLKAMSDEYKMVLKEIKASLNKMPPSGAMAGLYTLVDNSRGVWKAPANVSINGVTSPSVEISHDEQENLNVDVNGKSINAIRSFIGEGTLVWGARTLDGNSLDWRYINVRRTMVMLEQSIKLASKAYVFEANDAQTWVTIKSMIGNFLTGIWKRGGLAGASPTDAFSVHAGLGETMTSEDILEGILRVTVLVAITRPAEFIEITFQQQMQKS